MKGICGHQCQIIVSALPTAGQQRMIKTISGHPGRYITRVSLSSLQSGKCLPGLQKFIPYTSRHGAARLLLWAPQRHCS